MLSDFVTSSAPGIKRPRRDLDLSPEPETKRARTAAVNHEGDASTELRREMQRTLSDSVTSSAPGMKRPRTELDLSPEPETKRSRRFSDDQSDEDDRENDQSYDHNYRLSDLVVRGERHLLDVADPAASIVKRATVVRPRTADTFQVLQKPRVSTEEVLGSVCSCIDPEADVLVSICRLFKRFHNFSRGYVGRSDGRRINLFDDGSTIKIAAYAGFERDVERALSTLDQMFVVKRNGVRVDPRPGTLRDAVVARQTARTHTVLYLYAILEEMWRGQSPDNIINFVPKICIENGKRVKVNL